MSLFAQKGFRVGASLTSTPARALARALLDCIVMASNGESIPPEKDVIPDSNKCVEISTRSSVREMIAPGTYAVLAPLFVGFLVGPATLCTPPPRSTISARP